MTKVLARLDTLHSAFKALPLLSLFTINLLSLELGTWDLPLYPMLGLALYFHWMIYRPDCLPPLTIVMVILTNSAWISDTPSLILPLIYLGAYPVFLKFRHHLFGQRFQKIWLTFGGYSFLMTTLYWVLKAFLEKEFFSYTTLMISTLCIFLAYPLLTLLTSSLQRFIPLR